MPGLRVRGALVFAQAERTYRVAATTDTVDPLQADEWWLSQIGVDGLTPPGPGVPVSLVDSGLDFSHPEFAGRADTTALNTQEPASIGGEHGTSVASVIGAPQNGVGEVGIYPRAVLRSWDAAIGDGTQLESSEIAAGILAAARAGRGVINLSLGSDSPDLPIELAVSQAVALGSLVVAASGNDGDRGSPLGYPAAFPHVTTVAATDRSGNVASFSSRSSYVDLAAPGDEIIVASALGKNWRTASGTSFSSPLVAGAAAWIWTARPELTAGQVAEILRRSARDLGTPGRDSASGFGMLNVAAALALPAPIRDPYEPNDDVDEADPNGDRYVSKAPSLTTPTKRSARLSARIDTYEDPRDVYRVWLPAASTFTATLTATTDGDLALYAATARSVVGRLATTGRLATATTKGTGERLAYRNAKRGRWAYIVVRPGTGTLDATYSLRLDERGREALDKPLDDDRRMLDGARQDDVGLPDADTHARDRIAVDEGVGDSRRERLEEVIGVPLCDVHDGRHDIPVVDGVLDAVGRRRARVGEVELEVDEEPLPLSPLVLQHAVERMELDALHLDRHAGNVPSWSGAVPASSSSAATRPRSTAAAAASASTWERTSCTRNSVAPLSKAATAAPTEEASVPTRTSGPATTRASVDLRERPTRTGRPIATIRSSRRTSSRFWSGVFPKPIPGSRQTLSSAIPAATAKASRSSRNAATSETTSP